MSTVLSNLSPQDIYIHYAMKFVGRPYLWGGDDPSGFDCSGLALEMLTAFGFKLPDQTSDSLRKWCQVNSFPQEIGVGSLAFYGKQKITHVAVCINHELCVEAGGGGSFIKSYEDAVKHNAFIRVRPIFHRADVVDIYLPNYPTFPI